MFPHSGCAFEGRGKETDSDVSRARYPGGFEGKDRPLSGRREGGACA